MNLATITSKSSGSPFYFTHFDMTHILVLIYTAALLLRRNLYFTLFFQLCIFIFCRSFRKLCIYLFHSLSLFIPIYFLAILRSSFFYSVIVVEPSAFLEIIFLVMVLLIITSCSKLKTTESTFLRLFFTPKYFDFFPKKSTFGHF